MHAYLILYNMIIKDECRGAFDMGNYVIIESYIAALTITLEAPTTFTVILQHEIAIHISSVHD